MSAKVCIVMATYNPEAEFLRRQIRSIREQTLADWTCIINDDASDKVRFDDLARAVGSDTRFALFRNPHRLGVYHNFENALAHVPPDCELVALADQDDIWLPQKLARLAREFDVERVMMAHSDLSIIDEKDSLVRPSCWKFERRNIDNANSPSLLLLRNVVTGCASIFRRALLDSALPFPRQTGVPFYQHDLWLALVAAVQGKITAVPEPLVHYRLHGGNVLGPLEQGWAPVWRKFSRNRGKYFKRDYFVQVLERSREEWSARNELAEILRARFGENGLGVRAFRSAPDFGAQSLLLTGLAVIRRHHAAVTGLRIWLGKAQHDLQALSELVA